MESNIPIVGGSEAASNAQPAATPAAEVNNLTSVNPTLPVQPVEPEPAAVPVPDAVPAPVPAEDSVLPTPEAPKAHDHKPEHEQHDQAKEIDHVEASGLPAPEAPAESSAPIDAHEAPKAHDHKPEHEQHDQAKEIDHVEASGLPAPEAPAESSAPIDEHEAPIAHDHKPEHEQHDQAEEIDHYADDAGIEQHSPDHDEDGPDGVVSEGGLRKGDIIEGTIVSASPTEVLVDIGQKTEGVIQNKELDQITAAELELLKIGEKVLVYVVNPEDREGHAILSITRAREEQDWRDAEALRQSKGVYNGKVDGYNKGGLIVRFGRVRGFVPESQISRERRQRAEAAGTPDNKWAGMRGEDIGVKVLEVDRARNRLILSEREAAPQRRELMKVQLLDELQVGDVRVGRVKSLAEFGAFVDVGGADGLVHLTEISWKHVAHPQDVLKVGQEVKVEVISVDRDRKRIGLSIKRQEEDPWMALASQYAIGDLVQGTITKLVKFGAFARLVDNPEIEGLIHITELADRRVVHPRDVVNEGDVLTLRVVKIEGDRRRIGLSLKRVNSAAYVDRDYARATNTPTPPPPISDVADFEAASLRSEEDRRRERRKPAGGSGGSGGSGSGPGSGGAKKGSRRGGRGDSEDEFGGGDY